MICHAGVSPGAARTDFEKSLLFLKIRFFDDRKRKENHHESKTECETHLREVQDHQAQRPHHGYLREPEAQAETGLNREQYRRSGCVEDGRPEFTFPVDADIKHHLRLLRR
jgi:hypothetical protein